MRTSLLLVVSFALASLALNGVARGGGDLPGGTVRPSKSADKSDSRDGESRKKPEPAASPSPSTDQDGAKKGP